MKVCEIGACQPHAMWLIVLGRDVELVRLLRLQPWVTGSCLIGREVITLLVLVLVRIFGLPPQLDLVFVPHRLTLP